jgi:hypothetical protein
MLPTGVPEEKLKVSAVGAPEVPMAWEPKFTAPEPA